MTKRIFLSCVFTTLLQLSPASAQLSFGIKGGLSSSELNFNKSDFDTKGKLGWCAGLALKFNLPLGLGADISALYDQRTLSVNDYDNIKQKSILIPLNARFDFSIVKIVGVYVATGPQFAFNVGDKSFNWETTNELKEDIEHTFNLKSSAFSWNIGAGAMLLKHLELGFTYNIPLGNTSDASFTHVIDELKKEFKNSTSKTNSWTIHACYYF